MGGYITVWHRRPAFDDNGQRERVSATLAEARMIMQLAFMSEPGFRPGHITDSAGRRHTFELADPLASEQDYQSHGFERYEEWVAHPPE